MELHNDRKRAADLGLCLFRIRHSFLYWEPEAARRAVATIARLAILGMAGLLTYLSFDVIRAALTGRPSKFEPGLESSKAATRTGGLIWGLMMGAIAIFAASFALGLWGEFSH